MAVQEQFDDYEYTARSGPQLEYAMLLEKPADVPEDYIAYNPSGIWTTVTPYGDRIDVLYARVEPDRANGTTSHLGKSAARAYQIDIKSPKPFLKPYEFAPEIPGEDPYLTKVNRKLPSGKTQSVWLLSTVDAQPMPDAPGEVGSLQTRFYAGETLDQLEHIANGPQGMKDIRVVQGPDPEGTQLAVYGRPQPQIFSGNITHSFIPGLDGLNEQSIAQAPFIDEQLLPIGSGIWGGVNDVFHVGDGHYILSAHRAWRQGIEGNGRHYEAVFYEHDTRAKSIAELGVVATANMFPKGQVKDDAAVNLHDVVFPGGGYNGTMDLMTFGVRDATIGLGFFRGL